jgi:hypothetical protein
VETDTFTPTKKQFTPIFNKVGDEVWNSWDKYLQDQADDGMNNESSEGESAPLTHTLNRRRGGTWWSLQGSHRQKCALATQA